ncbi:S1 RNA-binding domain-containing protein [bacterium]|nr:S1 RNA-binding domain-containing protein [candidate division CSSED10-310 bacterium]
MTSGKKDKQMDWDDSMGMTMEEFEEALNDSLTGDAVRVGDKVTGTVISMTDSTVFVDIGGKSEGVIQLDEFLDDTQQLMVNPGDRVEATVISTKHEIRLSFRMRKRDQTLDMLREAFAGGIAVEGRVETVNKGGFDIRLGERRAFCPISQIDIDFVETPEPYLGRDFHFLITSLDGNGRNIVVSRSRLLQVERDRLAKETLASLRPGMIVTGTVRRIMNFGAFVDLGGVEGLVHVSQLSWDRIVHPDQVVSIGDTVSVKVIQIDTSTDKPKISLSIRDAQARPWDIYVGKEIVEGGSYSGEVLRIENFGAFVRLRPGIEGLLHISEMSWTRRVSHPSEIVKVGDSVTVKVTQIDSQQHRLALSLKQADDDPWKTMESAMAPGNLLSVEIDRIQSAGLEVRVSGLLPGFIPASLSGIGQGERLQNTFQSGSIVPARVVEADPATHRLILEIVDMSVEHEQQQLTRYGTDAASPETGFGRLGTALQKAMSKKKTNP